MKMHTYIGTTKIAFFTSLLWNLPHLTNSLALSKTPNAFTSTISISSPQLLEFREPRTNVTVILVGAMHYNPTSVQLAKNTIQDLGESDKLGSVVIESCDIRYNKTVELYEESPLLKQFLDNEMRTARDTAMIYNRPVVLGDQRINITTTAMKDSIIETCLDLVNPISGWSRFWKDVSASANLALPTGEGYLNAFAILDPRLLIAAPVSFFKYNISILSRSPALFAILVTLVALSDPSIAMSTINTATVDVSAASVPNELPLEDMLVSFGVSGLEILVFSRLFIRELLAKRNEILAKNILEQCKLYANSSNNKNKFGLRFPSKLPFSFGIGNSDKMETEAVYADDTIIKDSNPTNIGTGDLKEEKVVVAVLGMAHCNGIMKLLKEQMI